MFQNLKNSLFQPAQVMNSQSSDKQNVEQKRDFDEPFSMRSNQNRQQQPLQEEGSFVLTNSKNILITVLMPCLNEALTLADCIQQAHRSCQNAIASYGSSGYVLSKSGNVVSDGTRAKYKQISDSDLSYEILIADNGSTDGSIAIAIANGAQVVHVEQKGYGSALRGGIAAARGKYIIMGDSDSSYDFGEVPHFVAKLEEGFDVVIGNRFTGGIMPGAMPWHHRYIGNPVLSTVGRILFRTTCRDWHCGLRAFESSKVRQLKLSTTGMEFASEVVMSASVAGLRITEIPVTLSPDGRDRRPHLRSFRDGWRHLSLIMKTFVLKSSFCNVNNTDTMQRFASQLLVLSLTLLSLTGIIRLLLTGPTWHPLHYGLISNESRIIVGALEFILSLVLILLPARIGFTAAKGVGGVYFAILLVLNQFTADWGILHFLTETSVLTSSVSNIAETTFGLLLAIGCATAMMFGAKYELRATQIFGLIPAALISTIVGVFFARSPSELIGRISSDSIGVDQHLKLVNVRHEEIVTTRFYLTNFSKNPVTIDFIEKSCGCMTATNLPITIDPAGRADFLVTIDLDSNRRESLQNYYIRIVLSDGRSVRLMVGLLYNTEEGVTNATDLSVNSWLGSNIGDNRRSCIRW